MKNTIVRAVLLAASFLTLTGASWEGVAALAPVGVLPERGFYISSNSYPKNTVVDVVNLETGQTIQAIVQYSQNTPGGLVLLSRDAAGAIGVPESSTGRIRITSTTDTVANSLFFDGRDGRSLSGDPDFDPRAAVRSYGLPNEAASYRPPAATPPPYSVIDNSRRELSPAASVAPAAPAADTMPSIVSSPPLPLDPIVINMPPPVPVAVTPEPVPAPAKAAVLPPVSPVAETPVIAAPNDTPQISPLFLTPLGSGESFAIQDFSPVPPAYTPDSPKAESASPKNNTPVPKDNPEISSSFPDPLGGGESFAAPALAPLPPELTSGTPGPAVPADNPEIAPLSPVPPGDSGSFALNGLTPAPPVTPEIPLADKPQESLLPEIESAELGGILPLLPQAPVLKEGAPQENAPRENALVEVVDSIDDPSAGIPKFRGEEVVYDGPDVVGPSPSAAGSDVPNPLPAEWADTPEVLASVTPPAQNGTFSITEKPLSGAISDSAPPEKPDGGTDIEVVEVINDPAAGTPVIRGEDVVFDGPEVVDAEPVDAAAEVYPNVNPTRVWTDTPDVVDAEPPVDAAAGVVVNENPSKVRTDTAVAVAAVVPPAHERVELNNEDPLWAAKAEDRPDVSGRKDAAAGNDKVELPVSPEPILPAGADAALYIEVPEGGADDFKDVEPKPPAVPHPEIETEIIHEAVVVVIRPAEPKLPPVIKEPQLPPEYRVPAPSPIPEPPEPLAAPGNITLPDTARVSVLIRPPVPEPPQKVETPVVSPVIPEPAPPPSPSDAIPHIKNLERGKYYLQVGIYNRKEDIDKDLGSLRKNLPLVIQNTTEDPVLKLMVGPLNEGESNAMLLRLKKDGHKEAFIRHGGGATGAFHPGL
jgi:hypothetical protein